MANGIRFAHRLPPVPQDANPKGSANFGWSAWVAAAPLSPPTHRLRRFSGDIAAPVPHATVLFHELIHAKHWVAGRAQSGPASAPHWTNLEEERTIKTGKTNEGQFQREIGLPVRNSHCPPF